MRLVKTATVEAGTKLGKTIYNENGRTLVKQGISLEDTILKRLIQLGITYIYIDDKQTADIQYDDPISIQLKQEAISTITRTFKEIELGNASSRSIILEKPNEQFKSVVHSIMDELNKRSEFLSILSDVCIYDSYIFTHSFNVTLYALAVGMELKLNRQQLEMIGLGAIMHDIGKASIPKEILSKPERLTDEEFRIIQTHTTEGFEMMRHSYSIPLLVAHCAFQHHERLDGSGYPRGIKEKDIHDFAKIIAVADVFYAVTSNRVYRSAMLPHEGLEFLYAGVGKQFQKEVVEAFHKAIAVYPVGITVELNDGRKGVVVRQNSGFSERPVVRILEREGREIEPYEVNLGESLSVVITGCDTTFKQ